jgi:putative sugar O-methyltransferase
MDNKTKISFIIPAYNCADTVAESLLSIINGNLEEGDEIVVCNDCSTDATAAVLADFSRRYPVIKVVNHEKNLGGGAARNTAVRNTKNELIFCLDSDNVLARGSISRLKKYLIDTKADAASFGELRNFKRKAGWTNYRTIYRTGVVTFADALASHMTPPCSGNYLFTKASWTKAGGYPEAAGALDTWGFGIRQLATGARMMVLPRSFYFHRYGRESYWIRHEKTNNSSVLGLQIITPYFDRLAAASLEYLKNNQATWFFQLPTNPLVLKNAPVGQGGSEKRGLLVKIYKKIKNIGARLSGKQAGLSKINMKLTKVINRLRRKIFYLAYRRKELTPATAVEEERIRELREKIKSLPAILPDSSASEAEKSWRRNVISLRQQISAADPRDFLNWEVVQSTMFFQANWGNYVEYQELKKSWNYWKDKLAENRFGNPKPFYLLKDSSGNLVHYAYSLEQLRKISVDVKDFEQIVEVGGGYGGLARLVFKLGFSGDYLIYDLPEFSALQEYYLRSVDEEIARKTSFVSYASDLKDRFKAGKKTLFIATWSLSEMPIATRQEIFRSLGRIDAYLIAYQKSFGEVNNGDYFASLLPDDQVNLKKNYRIEHLPDDYYLLAISK